MKRMLSRRAVALALILCLICLLGAGARADSLRVDLNTLANTPMDVALLSGTWYEMGYQLGTQYPDSIAKGCAFGRAHLQERWGGREEALAAMAPYLQLCKTAFSHPEDGSYADMMQGVADATGIGFDDVAMYFLETMVSTDIPFGVEPGDEQAYYASLADDRQAAQRCSFSVAWGDAAASGGAPIVAANNDAGYDSTQYLPTLVLRPDHGYTTIVAMGIFGCTCNDAGLALFGASGSVHGVDRIGLDPYLFVNAYCATVEEALDLMGRPEAPKEDWWPIGCCVNTVMADAAGRVVVYEYSSVKRALREIGDPKFIGKTALGDITLADETAQYMVGNNFFCTESMYADSVANVALGPGSWWDDCLPRYWTVEKYIQDAVAGGGVTADTLRQAQGSHMYYIPEGWDYDAYPDCGYLGYWVPSHIYEGFADGTIDRADYYGEAYNPETWGEPLSLERSRSCPWWSTGWHDNYGQWTLNLGMNLWSPEPQSADFKTTHHFIFDTNTTVAYICRSTASRLAADVPGSTGTYVPMFLNAISDGQDPFGGMVAAAEADMKEQIWLAAKNLTEKGVDIDTADGQVLYGYLETGRECMRNLMLCYHLGVAAQDENEKLLHYSRAYTYYAKGVSHVQLAQADPQALAKDFGATSPFEP